MGSKQEAIFRTLLYSDLFNCPLREDELFYYLNTKEKILQKDISKISLQTPGVYEWKGWYSLRRSHQSIRNRQERVRISEAKIALARRIIRWITWVPSLRFIGLSGSVAAGNAEVDDDIDFFVIISKGNLFTARLFILFTLQLLGKRRKPHELKAANKACLNMLIDEASLVIPESRRNLYTAREIGQLLPLFERNNMYQRFLRANGWTKSFLPNIGRKEAVLQGKVFPLGEAVLSIFEPLTKLIEIRYMKKRQTVEQVNTHSLAFHLNDTAARILRRYETRLKTLELTISR